MDGAYGTIDPAWLSRQLTADPVWIHITWRRNLPAIAQHGLQPATSSGPTTATDPAVAPRPGCIYLAHPADYDFVAEQLHGSFVNYDDLAAVGVDVAALAPERLLPDEDAFTSMTGLCDPTDWGIAPYDPDRHDSQGAWADHVRLGAQPDTVEASMTELRKIAVRGPIAPALLRATRLQHGRATNAGPLTPAT